MNQSFANTILQVAKDDGDYQAISRLCKCEKAYLKTITSMLKIDAKGTKRDLAKAILSKMKEAS